MFKIKNYKKTLFISVFTLICILLHFVFPTNNFAQKITSVFIFLFILPLSFGKIIEKKQPKHFGLTIGDWKKGLLFSIISLAISFLILFFLFKFNAFQENYSITKLYGQNFMLFVFYEFLIIGSLYFCFSFFFNGFILLSLRENIGLISPLVSFIIFLIFMFFDGSLTWLFSFMFLNIFLGGFIALKSNSLLYPVISGIIFQLIADSLVIKFFN